MVGWGTHPTPQCRVRTRRSPPRDVGRLGGDGHHDRLRRLQTWQVQTGQALLGEVERQLLVRALLARQDGAGAPGRLRVALQDQGEWTLTRAFHDQVRHAPGTHREVPRGRPRGHGAGRGEGPGRVDRREGEPAAGQGRVVEPARHAEVGQQVRPRARPVAILEGGG